MLYFYGIILLLFLCIYTKTVLIAITIILNSNYLLFLYNYEIHSNIRNYIIFNILLIIVVYEKNALLPLCIIYIYLFLLYLIYSLKNIFIIN